MHTPGPWRVGSARHTVFGPPNGNPSPETIAQVGKNLDNAALIAAAPELLEALKGALEVVGSWGDDGSPEWVRTAQEAINKAEGKP